MSTCTHRTAVVIIPPREVWAPIQHLRRQFDRQYRRWMPHITMIYPFRPPSEFDRLVPVFAPVVAAFPFFDVTLREVYYFRHRNQRYTLWLKPEPAETLVHLQDAIQRLVPACNHVQRYPGGFTPHLSIGQAHGRTHLEQRLQYVRHYWKPITFTVTALYFIWRNDPPDDVFRIGCQIPLGESSLRLTRCIPSENPYYQPE